jgi:hypothetical protein
MRKVRTWHLSHTHSLATTRSNMRTARAESISPTPRALTAYRRLGSRQIRGSQAGRPSLCARWSWSVVLPTLIWLRVLVCLAAGRLSLRLSPVRVTSSRQLIVPTVTEEMLARHRSRSWMVHRWMQTFGGEVSDAVRPARHSTGVRWVIDETYVNVAGRWIYLDWVIDTHVTGSFRVHGTTRAVREQSRRGASRPTQRAACDRARREGDQLAANALNGGTPSCGTCAAATTNTPPHCPPMIESTSCSLHLHRVRQPLPTPGP